MDYKLIAIDMDGTLLTDKKEIAERNKKVITAALQEGIKVVLASGRVYKDMIDSANQLGISGPNQYLIECGGNQIENLEHKLIYQKLLNNSTCEKIAHDLETSKIKFVLIDNQGGIYGSYQEWMEKHMLDAKLGIVKFLMRTHKRKLPDLAVKLHEKFDQDYFIVVTSDEEVELFPKEVSKGHAVDRLAKHLKINPKQVMAIGDRDNDIPMMKLAGLGIAMGNSTEKVKNISNAITADNNHSGVADAIEKYALSEK